MNRGKDVALESLDQGFEESKNMQLLLFLNDQANISNRLKSCRFKENSNNNGVSYAPDSRVLTAPEAATRTHRLRPLSARPSTASGRQYQEPEPDKKIDFDNLSVSGRRSSAVRRHAADSSSSTSSSSPTQRPGTTCGFYDLTDVEEESDDDFNDVESDLDVLSIESITSTSPCDDIDDEELDGVTYEFDVLESDRRHIEVDTREHVVEDNIPSVPSAPTRRALTRRHTTNDMSPSTPMSSPTREKSSKSRKSVPNNATTSVNKTVIKTYHTEPHPPSRVEYETNGASEVSSTSTVLRHMRTRLSSTELKDRGRVNSFSKGVVWGDPIVNDKGSSSHHFRSPSDRSPLNGAAPMSPRISFEEIPIERQGMSLRTTVARIDCDASFYRKLRHRSAPALRTDELTTSRSEGNSPVRAKPIGIYHLPPLSKETSPTSSAHSGARTLAQGEFLAQQVPQHKTVFQEPNLLH